MWWRRQSGRSTVCHLKKQVKGGIEMFCPVCTHGAAKVESHPTRDASMVDCPQCGQFTISGSAAVNLRNEDDSKRWQIAAWINEFAPTMVTSIDIDLALASAVPSLHHRADRMLRWIATAFPPGIQFAFKDLGNWKGWESSPATRAESRWCVLRGWLCARTWLVGDLHVS